MAGNESGGVPAHFPTELQIGKFASARIQEVLALQQYIDQPRQGQLASQQLPRHLRRRAVSHHPNRLPRRLRDKHRQQKLKSDGQVSAKPAKRPSRRYRRRPRNLLDEYNRRQRTHVWLETHIWHAKRFAMVEKWGYKIPDHPNDKHFRAAFRASAQSCLMWDRSYWNCFELKGPEEILMDQLNSIVGPDVSMKRSDVLSGLKESHVCVYQPGKYPLGVIGSMSLLWRPSEDGKGHRTLWIWSHPSIYVALKSVFLTIFGLTQAESKDEESAKINPPPEKKPKKDVNASKIALKNVPFVRVPSYSDKNGVVTLNDLKDTLNRFRLVGPKVQMVLSRALQLSPIQEEKLNWLKEVTKDEEEEQKEAWREVSQHAPGEIQRGSVLSLIVRDPRVLLPPKRDGIQFPELDVPTPCMFKSKESVAKSVLWNSDIRDEVTQFKCPDHDINQKRSQNLVPGTPLTLTDDESRVPVMLIQQCGTSSNHYGAGWDLIFPAGWGASMWMNLVFNGARVGGLREENHFLFERAELNELARFPDSEAGQIEANRVTKVLKTLHFRYPPDKRPNHLKLSVISPFDTPWPMLIRNYLDDDLARKKQTQGLDCSAFFVIRDPITLKTIQDQLSQSSPMKYASTQDLMALVPVKLEIIGKGTLGQFSMICCPNLNDSIDDPPHEPAKEDRKMAERKALKDKHIQDKARLRKRWKDKKDRIVQMRVESTLSKTDPDEETIEKIKEEMSRLKEKRELESSTFNAKMNSLWLSDATDAKNSCTRSVMGFVLEANFSLSLGQVCGLGYIPLLALYEYSLSRGEASRSHVLTRETNTNQYRWAKMTISNQISNLN